MHHYGFTGPGSDQVRQTINWRFFDQIPRTIPNQLDSIQRLISEAKFERPFFETIELLSRETTTDVTLHQAQISVSAAQISRQNKPSDDDPPQLDDGIMEHRALNIDAPASSVESTSHLFVYSFRQGTTMDLRGRTNYFGGAGHTADLLFLMGPSLFQQIGRRKMSMTEERLCKKMRRYFVDFVKTGNPTPGRLFDAWLPYRNHHKFVQMLGGDLAPEQSEANYLDRNQLQIAQMLSGESTDSVVSNAADPNPYSIDNSRIDTSSLPKSYLPDTKHSPYYLAIGKVSSFWDDLLPKMQRDLNKLRATDGQPAWDPSNPSRQDLDLAEAGSSSKFRHAFFSMLALVCLLLAILGVCLYILRKSRATIDTSYL